MSDVEGSLVLLPVSGKGVLTHVDGGGLLHGVDQEIADCRFGGGEVTLHVHCCQETTTRTRLYLLLFSSCSYMHAYRCHVIIIMYLTLCFPVMGEVV